MMPENASIGVPRTRGDGPFSASGRVGRRAGSPHTRGWTPCVVVPARLVIGFPAHAGMDPTGKRLSVVGRRVPRTRGDGPQSGCSGRRCRLGSPHTRGWTAWRPWAGRSPLGFPAHAGMDPPCAASSICCTRVPRTRGDGPQSRVNEIRGGKGSPHTRGWTVMVDRLTLVIAGFPAHAGMDPRGGSSTRRSARVPRTRGDGPPDAIEHVDAHAGSPHTRGWTRRDGRDRPRRAGFPAHAGMDPYGRIRRPAVRRVPRTRGDGPGPPRRRGRR